MVLVRGDSDFNLISIRTDDEGRYIVLEAEVQRANFLLVKVYVANKVQEQCRFIENLNSTIDDVIKDNEPKLVVGGDFNVTLESDLDCSGGNPAQKASVKSIQDLCLDFDLVDIWRIRNPTTRRFTWRQRNPFIQRRLDFWLISDVCQEDIEGTDIIPSINSDHSAIILHFNNIDRQKHGPSFWKFNASLLNDENFVLLINQSVPLWLDEFKEVIDKRVLWDLIKYRIRQVTINYSKEKARQRRQKISDIENSRKVLEEKCGNNPTTENIEQLEILKLEHENIYEEFSKGAIIRSKATWYEKGEKSNKYFLNLESHRKAKSSVRKVFSEDELLVTDPKKILEVIEGFFSFLENPLIPRLSVDDSQVCEWKLTIEECVKSLNSFEPNKSPGNDGLTVEFYNFFWNIVGELLVASLNYSYDAGELSNSQKKAIIILLGKKIRIKDTYLTGDQYL